MNGLLKSNFYAARSNARLFTGIILLLGTFVAVIDNDITTLLIGYMLLCMVGFSVTGIAGIHKDNSSKWGKHKLMAPVRRKDIVKSYFISLVGWLLIGVIFAAIVVGLSILLHGFPFDREIDLLLLFFVGISGSLYMSAIFFPLFYLGGDERNEAILIISLLCAVGIIMRIVSFLNWFFGPDMSLVQIMLGAGIILISGVLVFCLSYPLSAAIFKRKDY